MTVYRVIVPVVPPREVWPNVKKHWGTKNRAVKQLRQGVARVVKAEMNYQEPMLSGAVRVEIGICWPEGQRRRLDPDNALGACKAILDGMTDAGMWRSDHRVHAQVVRQQLWGEWGKEAGHRYPGGCVILDIEEVQHE